MQVELGFSLFDWILAHLPSWLVQYVPQVLIDRLRPIATTWQTKGEELLSSKLQPILGPLKPAITVLTNLKDSTVGFLDKATKLTNDCITEYNEIKNFKEDLHWRGRVVNAPEVVKKVKHLTEIPLEIANAIKDLFKRIQDQTPGGKPLAEAAGDAVEDLEGIQDFRGFVEKLGPKFGKGCEKFLGVLAIVVECIIAWNAAVDDLQLIVNDIREVRLDIEKLDVIFLPQNHARRWVTLEDGRRTRWRIGGHLHPV